MISYFKSVSFGNIYKQNLTNCIKFEYITLKIIRNKNNIIKYIIITLKAYIFYYAEFLFFKIFFTIPII